MPRSGVGDFTPKLSSGLHPRRGSEPQGCPQSMSQLCPQPQQIPRLRLAAALVHRSHCLTHPQGDDAEERKIIPGHKSIQRERGRATKPGRAVAPAGFLCLTIPSATAPLPGQEQLFQDCAEVHRAGIHTSGVYTLHIANLSEPKKVSAAQRGLPPQHPGVAPRCPPQASPCRPALQPVPALPTAGVLRHGDRPRGLDSHPAPHQRQPQLPEELEGVQAGLHPPGEEGTLGTPRASCTHPSRCAPRASEMWRASTGWVTRPCTS